MGARVLLAVSATVLAAAPLAAQPAPDRLYMGLERSRIFYSPGNNTVFEAQLAPQLVVAQRLVGLFESDGVYGDGERHRGWNVSVSPMVRLRMSKDRSQPVLPPSYMPHVVGQLFFARSMADPGDGLSEFEAELARREAAVGMWALEARLSHHSNGQDGCLFETQTLEPVGGGEACAFAPGAGPDPAAVNFDDGSFSTNFLRLGAAYRRLAPDDEEEDVLGSTWFVGGGVELHTGPVLDALPGALPEDQRELYGTWRWRLDAGASWRRASGFWAGGTHLEAHFEHAPDVRDDVPAWSVQLEGYHLLDRFGGWGLYARIFHGQDYYNLAFVREETFVHVGLAWAQDRFGFGLPTGGG